MGQPRQGHASRGSQPGGSLAFGPSTHSFRGWTELRQLALCPACLPGRRAAPPAAPAQSAAARRAWKNTRRPTAAPTAAAGRAGRAAGRVGQREARWARQGTAVVRLAAGAGSSRDPFEPQWLEQARRLRRPAAQLIAAAARPHLVEPVGLVRFERQAKEGKNPTTQPLWPPHLVEPVGHEAPGNGHKRLARHHLLPCLHCDWFDEFDEFDEFD